MKLFLNARQKLLDRVIHIFGYEHEQTLYFSYVCDILPDTFRNYILLRTWVSIIGILNKCVGFDVPWN